MDDLLAEGLEILDCDDVRITQLTKKKSQKAAAAQTEKHKTNKKFRKQEKANKEAASARFGLNNKYVADKKIAEKRLKKVDREKELAQKHRLVQKSRVDTDFNIWCKITGVTKPEVQKPVEEEESAFDEEYFAQFEKEYAERKLNG
ncbi:Oidioi.mRNA.OKI2018_I69.XSR.g15911.t1.cds [Oikopleura dioica]|uniref:Oidioi.mRNA.OKI2018_I69.XSR.g15911.t1.cds n=1 Tax=Oikopleura dioica TaxID=34765 RepID=A0ABN7SEW8_OIKDI|nr:Oidioi.mRNA.OKI2018_I69.XSR.g15911.t1.cds [Oikopleura dioica]